MNPSFGSGSQLLGAPASAILSQAPGMAQQSPSSAGFQPGVLPPPPMAMPSQAAPMGSPPPSPQQSQPPQINPYGQQPAPALPQPQGGVVGMPPENQESMLILQALSNRLKSLSKVSEAQKIPPVM